MSYEINGNEGYGGGSGKLGYGSFDYSSFVSNGCGGGFHGEYSGGEGENPGSYSGVECFRSVGGSYAGCGWDW